jgi:hypothetical protein
MLKLFMFKVGIIRINFKLLFIRSNLFSSKNFISSFCQLFLLFTFFLEFALLFPKKFNNNSKLGKFETWKNMLVVGG